MSEVADRKSSQRLKRTSEEGQRGSPSASYSSSDESPRGRKLRKLPSREDLQRSPLSPNSNRNTSTPRLKALGDKLSISIFTSEDESYTGYDSLIDDQEKKLQARDLLGISVLNSRRRKSSEYMFKCPTCKKQFKYLSNLKSHLSIVHKNLYANSNNASIENNTPLKQSNNTDNQEKQSKKKGHQCEVCLKMFKYASNLKTHRKVHSTLD